MDKLSIDELISRIDRQVPDEIKENPNNDVKPFYYVQRDIAGYWYNAKYPPDVKRFGNEYGGYPSDAAEILFYNFAIQCYDVQFKYNGKWYYLIYEADHAGVCRKPFSDEYLSFPDPNTLIEQFEIEGIPLIKLIDQLEDIEAM